MSKNLAYPLNPDTSFESFILTDEAAVKAAFGGKTYSVADLVPMNYSKILAALKAGTLTYAPIRHYINMDWSNAYTVISDEEGYNLQSKSLRSALLNLLSYWQTDLLGVAPFQCPMGVVTEMKNDVIFKDTFDTDFNGTIKTTIKINWFVIPGSLYS